MAETLAMTLAMVLHGHWTKSLFLLSGDPQHPWFAVSHFLPEIYSFGYSHADKGTKTLMSDICHSNAMKPRSWHVPAV
ncbi:hypothetical protein B0H14DRAFT_2677920 [Mycena olivaceomarginata]|nr:hypothetical protein B0H14DRAFT_2677920 [Mycena olivaceomarginata]